MTKKHDDEVTLFKVPIRRGNVKTLREILALSAIFLIFLAALLILAGIQYSFCRQRGVTSPTKCFSQSLESRRP